MNIKIETGPEALAWLRSNGHEAALASNRFPDTPSAIRFVEHLYELGVRRVFIPQDSIVADEEELNDLGGPYSDTLVIEIGEAAISPELEVIYQQEATLEGYDLKSGHLPLIQGRYLLLWWD